MQTLVIGANGWIGQSLVDYNASIFPANISSNSSIFEFKEWLNEQNYECFINCVGKFNGSESDMEWANVGILELILERARRIGSRVITLGSAAEYGNVDHSLLREDDKPNPISIYGRQKLIATNLINDYIEVGVSCVSARLFNVLGPGQPATTALGQIVRKINGLESDTIFSLDDYDIERDYISLEFVTETIMKLITLEFSGILNVGSGQPVKLLDVVTEYAKIRNVNVLLGNLNANRVLSAVADTSKLNSLGIRPNQLTLRKMSDLIMSEASES
jgi:nucleoside-diphosphate-sugar epimerase